VLEIELKAVITDERALRERIEGAGGRLRFEGRMEDRRYDLGRGELTRRDEVVRVRVQRPLGGGAPVAQLDWKGPTRHEGGYKQREELSVPVGAPDTMTEILHRLGFHAVEAIDRMIAEYALAGTTVRIERYPRMDLLVEVEGAPDAIERAIEMVGLPRSSFSFWRLADFAKAYEARTGQRAVLNDGEIA